MPPGEKTDVEFPRFGGHSDTWVKEDVHMPKSHAPYPPEYRQQMVELVKAGRTPEELSQEFEPSAQAIRNWVQQAERDEGRREDGLPSAEREELGRLRRDNKQLRIEREILAKAAAWFARETDSIPSTSSSSRALTRISIPSPPCAACWKSRPAGTMRGAVVSRRRARNPMRR